jgi:hypothetical protein
VNINLPFFEKANSFGRLFAFFCAKYLYCHKFSFAGRILRCQL